MEKYKYKEGDKVIFNSDGTKAEIIAEVWTPLRGVNMYQLKGENGTLLTASEGSFRLCVHVS